ncbi:unnamed protein product [Caenorhabditis bovis]|uniref:RNA helicase n=1 Tax=Caenorhabditis bovis TaxID=2654633 RepID=A0A8S1EBA5_9PELO|nr:unnamed protein product [Caenorhabditis bovis]
MQNQEHKSMNSDRYNELHNRELRGRNDDYHDRYNDKNRYENTRGFKGERASNFDRNNSIRDEIGNVPSYKNQTRGGSFNNEFGSGGRSDGFEQHDDGRGFGTSRRDFQLEPRKFYNSGGFEDSSPSNQRDQLMEQRERAPRDWEPEQISVEEMIAEVTDDMEGIEVDSDQKLNVINCDDDVKLSSWKNSGLNEKILKNVEALNYTKVRPIQAAVIPLVLRGYDLMGQAETGGGKTAAFGLPIVHKLMSIPDEERTQKSRHLMPYCIILAPVRELARQIYNQFRIYSRGTGINVVVSYGEMSRYKSLEEISRGCDILIGTCGRIMDFISKGDIRLENLRFFVLDEADRLLEDVHKGSGPHLATILNCPEFVNTAKQRQTLLFSATFSPMVENFAEDIMKPISGQNKIVRVVLAQGRLNPRVNLVFEEANGIAEKNEKLENILSKSRGKARNKTLIFVKQKKRSDFLASALLQQGINARSINGDRPQNTREEALREFKSGKINVLVGTDVCSRGLDIRDLDQVVNYDLPDGNDAIDTFIHRVGRTGRLRPGTAYSFIGDDDKSLMSEIIKVMKDSNKEDQIPSWMKTRQSGNFSSEGFPATKGFGFGGASFTGSFGEGSGKAFGSSSSFKPSTETKINEEEKSEEPW